MRIIGCDFHSRYQQVAWVDAETGEIRQQRLEHGGEQVRAFYAGWSEPGRVGIEATGYTDWFERLPDLGTDSGRARFARAGS